MKTQIQAGLVVGALALGGVYAATSNVAAQVVVPAQAPGLAPKSSFVPIAAYRALDTRQSLSDKIRVKETRLIDVSADTSGTVQLPDTVTAVTFNVTVTQTEGKGFLQVFAPNTTFGSTSTLNWDGNETVANSGTVTVFQANPGNGIGLYVDGAAAAAHVIIDITGCYEP
jgi:hypothetical protein